MIPYRSISKMNRDVRAWLKTLSEEIDVIVGIPRSGLLVANLLSLYMNKPVSDLDSFLEGRVIETGFRYSGERIEGLLCAKRRILVVDDTINSGREMARTKQRIESANLPHQIFYGALYVTPGAENLVDCFYEVVSYPRLFEWNVFHHYYLSFSCVDIDGILCRDPTEEENDDGEKYESFIRCVKPFIVPANLIGWLVTCRLEKYRSLTEEWLANHDVRYNHLVMMDLPSKEARIRSNSHASYKAKIYIDTGAKLFMESSPRQAAEIAKLTGKPVLCVETGEMICPDRLHRNMRRCYRISNLLLHNPREAARKVRRRFCGLWQRLLPYRYHRSNR